VWRGVHEGGVCERFFADCFHRADELVERLKALGFGGLD